MKSVSFLFTFILISVSIANDCIFDSPGEFALPHHSFSRAKNSRGKEWARERLYDNTIVCGDTAYRKLFFYESKVHYKEKIIDEKTFIDKLQKDITSSMKSKTHVIGSNLQLGEDFIVNNELINEYKPQVVTAYNDAQYFALTRRNNGKNIDIVVVEIKANSLTKEESEFLMTTVNEFKVVKDHFKGVELVFNSEVNKLLKNTAVDLLKNFNEKTSINVHYHFFQYYNERTHLFSIKAKKHIFNTGLRRRVCNFFNEQI